MNTMGRCDPPVPASVFAGSHPVRDIRILIVDSNAERAAIIAAGLTGLASTQILRANDLIEMRRVEGPSRADVVIIACDRPDSRTFDRLRELNAEDPRPVVIFAETSDPAVIERAVGAGVSSYVVNGLSEPRVLPVVELAIARFRHVHRLNAELHKAKADLAARKTIERAKGILMERRKMSEADAYGFLRRSAMERGETIADIADAILSVTRLLEV